MKRVMATSVLMAFWVNAVVPRAALAYVDPGTGGMLFQLLAVAFASITALLLLFSRQIRTLGARLLRAARRQHSVTPGASTATARAAPAPTVMGNAERSEFEPKDADESAGLGSAPGDEG